MPGTETVVARDRQGHTHEVPIGELDSALTQNDWSVETPEQHAERRSAEVLSERYGGTGGALKAGLVSGASGLTFGASDALAMGLGDDDTARTIHGLRAAHPIASTVGNVAGAIGGTLLTGVGGAVTGLAKGAGALGRIAAGTGAAAAEGALQSAGAYVSDVALGDKKLAGEGLVAALGNGTFWGMAGGGPLSLAGEGLVAARRLFPAHQLTTAALESAKGEAVGSLVRSIDDGHAMEAAARQQLAEGRDLAMARDPGLRARLDEIKVKAAQDLAALKIAGQTARNEAEVARFADRAARRTARAKPEAPQDALSAGLGKETSPTSPTEPTSLPGTAERPSLPGLPDQRVTLPHSAPEVVAPPAKASDVARSAKGQTTTVNARDLLGARSLSDVTADATKMARARQAIAEGQRTPIEINVSPRGRYDVADGTHRLAAAIESNSPITVKWSRGSAAIDSAEYQASNKIVGWSGGRQTLLDVAPSAERGAAEAVAEEPQTLLERQLAGTKSALDSNRSLSELSGGREAHRTAVEDALNVEVAKADPQFARLHDAVDELRAGRNGVNEWMDSSEGWMARYRQGEVADFLHADTERNISMMFTRESAGDKARHFHLVEENANLQHAPGSAKAVRKTSARRRPAEQERDIYAESRSRRMADELTTGQSVEAPQGELGAEMQSALSESAPDVPMAPSEEITVKLEAALEHKSEDFGGDLSAAAKAITRHEAAHAELAELLGPSAPPAAAEQAATYRAAQAQAQDSTHAATAEAVAKIEDAMGGAGPTKLRQEVASGPAPTMDAETAVPAGKAPSLLDRAKDLGSGYEALRMLGVPLPDPHDIPVIGPVLSMYLKAKVLAKAMGRGGKVAATAESTIASKAAATRQRVLVAVGKLLEPVGRGVAAQAPLAGGVAAVLQHRLFDDGAPPKRHRSTPSNPDATLAELYHARADELARAAVPGAIAKAVKARVQTSDPAIVDAIVAAKERKLEWLSSKLPRSEMAPGILSGKQATDWVPAKSQLAAFARYVGAAEDPAAVLEYVAAGGACSVEAMETIKQVYPALFADAQRELVERAASSPGPVEYARRVQCSAVFGLPLDQSMSPDRAAFLQASYKPSAAAPAPHPTIASAVNTGQRTDPYRRHP